MLLYVKFLSIRRICTNPQLQILAVLIIGERNLFSTQVDYQTEPMVSIGKFIHWHTNACDLLTTFCAGQWAPIVGTGLALFGSLYVALAAGDPETPEESPTNGSPRPRSNCSPHGQESPRRPTNDLARTETHATLEGTRRTVAGWLNTVADYVGTPQKKSYDDAGFRRGRAMRFPQIPGEQMRNPALHQIDEQWTSRDPSREPSIRRANSGATRERSNTAETLQIPSPTHTRTSRGSLNLPASPQMTQINTLAREQSPPSIVVTPDPGPADRKVT